MLAVVEAYLYAGVWNLLSGPRLGRRLASTRFGHWAERKAHDARGHA